MQGAVVASGGQHPAGRCERDREYVALWSGEGRDQRRMGRIGEIPHPDGAVGDARGEGGAVGAERHGPDIAGRAGQRHPDLSRVRRVADVPQPYRLVRAADGEQP